MRPNEQKARYLRRHQRQAVTGVVVNDKVNWPRSRRRWLRQEVHYVSRFGIESHLAYRGYSQRRYKEFLYGHIYALSAIRPDEAEKLMKQLESVEWPY